MFMYLVGATITNLRNESLQLGDEIGDLVISDVTIGGPGATTGLLPGTRPSARHCLCLCDTYSYLIIWGFVRSTLLLNNYNSASPRELKGLEKTPSPLLRDK